jgi:hypothetical protein
VPVDLDAALFPGLTDGCCHVFGRHINIFIAPDASLFGQALDVTRAGVFRSVNAASWKGVHAGSERQRGCALLQPDLKAVSAVAK